MFKKKAREWFKRYWLAELIGLVLSLIAANLSMINTGNLILSAFMAAWAENLGYYGTIIYKDFNKRKRKKSRIVFKDIMKIARNMILEFGPAEYLDSFIIRPFYLALLPNWILNYSFAVLVANILANITYYIPTIFSYELRKKKFKD